MLTTKGRQRRVVGENRAVEMSLGTGVPELIVALDPAPELYTVLSCSLVVVGLLLSRLPSLDFGNLVPPPSP